MPAGDRTGPFGAGQMTGCRMSFCAGYGMPRYMNCGFWKRIEFKKNTPFINASQDYGDTFNEKDFLQREADILESQMKIIQQRLSELEKEENK